jgi:hypothetical protein
MFIETVRTIEMIPKPYAKLIDQLKVVRKCFFAAGKKAKGMEYTGAGISTLVAISGNEADVHE